jgi:hypothetical protein
VIAPALSLLLLAVGQAPATPRVELTSRGIVVATLPTVLADEPVRKHLATGLTTTLVVEVELEGDTGGPRRGAAQVAVRWDLWDEKFLLTLADRDGERHVELQGEEALRTWWSAARLQVLPVPLRSPRPLLATVRLTVLPFSRAEEEDTRSWFLRSLQRTDAREPAPAVSGEPKEQARTGLSEVYNALMATSIGRRSLLTYDWEVPVSETSP